ncbi:MAG: hypothetical protein RBU30_02875 [Polyangia bacterium]|nr:hypothetical protein [Polyangia bacterium]
MKHREDAEGNTEGASRNDAEGDTEGASGGDAEGDDTKCSRTGRRQRLP